MSARNPFGWEYPAGAEFDPSAPWNQPDACEACDGEGRIWIPPPMTDDSEDYDEDDGAFEECDKCAGSGLAGYVAPFEDY